MKRLLRGNARAGLLITALLALLSACGGNPSTATLGGPSATGPREARSSGPLVAITHGDQHACALDRAGRVYCWGDNRSFQLGRDRRSFEDDGSLVPEHVPLPGPALRVEAGGWHTCALLVDNALYCWGRNYEAQLGRRTAAADPRPYRVPDVGSIAELKLGRSTTCIRSTEDVVSCFGLLPYRSNRDEVDLFPREIAALRGAEALLIGPNALCGRFAGGEVRCEGPEGVVALYQSEAPADAIVWSDGGYCRASSTGAVECRGYPVCLVGDPTCQIPLSASAVALEGSSDAICSLDDGGAVQCVRFLASGRGSPQADWGNVDIPPADAISVGTTEACALVLGEAYCWRFPYERPLYRNQVHRITGPIDEMGLGAQMICTRRGRVVDCWEGAIHENGTLDPATARRRSEDATVVVAGDAHACVLHTDGRVLCWGDNAEGQLGDGTLLGRDSPTRVLGLSSPRAIAAAGNTTCGLDAAGAVWCWGRGVPTPTRVEGLGRTTEIALSPTLQCFLVAGGELRCRGHRSAGGTTVILPSMGAARVAHVRGGPAIVARVSDRELYTFDQISRTEGYWSARQLLLDVSVRDARARSLDVCLLSASGTASCWGTVVEGANALFTGGELACVRRTTGDVACIGPLPGDAGARTIPATRLVGPWSNPP